MVRLFLANSSKLQVTAKTYIKPLPQWFFSKETKILFKILISNDAEVRFVGGCVRDSLLQLPVTDIDIATTDRPEIVTEKLRNEGFKTINVGLSYGTVITIIAGRRFEVTTLRRDSENFGRQAKVEFINDWVEDANRRDFTINTLSCNSEGLVFDPFGGIDDLRNGQILFVGNPRKRIEEDHLRLLRFFRFFAWYGIGLPDPRALKACSESAQFLNKISGERLNQETLKLLSAPNPLLALQSMANIGVLDILLPGVTKLNILEDLLGLESFCRGSLVLDSICRLAALFRNNHDNISKISEKLKFSKIQAARFFRLTLPEPRLKPRYYRKKGDQTFYPFNTEDCLQKILLNWAEDGGLSSSDSDEWLALFNKAKIWVSPKFPLNGGDVISHGISSGELVGNLLRDLENFWIKESFKPNREDLLLKLEKEIKNLSNQDAENHQ
ncbi:MAG: CCA tRNA nucleotidyltransferase [Rhodospirillaceae bacterium]|nr:CCA tRNA nucleotidyltransferase [Rhodospirillaceae bacterium]